MESQTTKAKILSGTALIAGTSIGAGMLGIPLITSLSGFIPSLIATTMVWLFMMLTGLLLLEVTLWLPDGSNFLSISGYFLGRPGKLITGAFFAFLYYCLMIAYFAAGAPLFSHVMNIVFGTQISDLWGFILFGGIFGSIVAISPRSIDRVNIILTVAMGISWFLLLGLSGKEVKAHRLLFTDWNNVFIAFPVLFSAFGYHNIIPSLCTYLKRDINALKKSVIIGSTVPFIVYLLWQWLIIGSFDRPLLTEILGQGRAVTFALEDLTGNHWIRAIGQFFALFAIITSTLGVSFSLVDFLGDGFKIQRKGSKRVLLTFLTFFPPFAFALNYPAVFDKALSVAGGFGEAFLNGILPVSLLWIGRYAMKLKGTRVVPVGRLILALLFLFSCFTVAIEIMHLMGRI